MAVFRVEKNSGYTVMSNHHLRNRALSLKAKGLLSQMLSLPEDWDYTLQGLARINRESIDAIRQAIRELEQAGYIQRSRERDEKGRLRGADYVIFELPQPVPASVSPTLENPTLENPTQENPTLENAAPLTAGTTLEDIYRTFNVDHPADFKGHSLSVSDVVVLHQNGQNTAHYCDSVGFQQVPEFLRENPLRTAELSTEQNENMIDGVLNNASSLGELEAKAKAGEQISLTDLAAAVKAEEKAPKAKKSRAAKPKKPSIRAQLDAAKKEQSKQSPPREKTKELEV